MGSRLNYSGLVVAGLGFFLTRFTVTLAISEDPVRFYLSGVVPLVLGLGLAAVGVALTVADVESSFVRTTARWSVVGFGSMLVLVVLTLLGSTGGAIPNMEMIRSQTYLSNFLIGGSIGGLLTGVYASRTRRQRSELETQADRLDVLNQLLRHEVRNALTPIRGFAARASDDGRVGDVIDRNASAIERTIEEVESLTQGGRHEAVAVGAMDVGPLLDGTVQTVTDRYPSASVSVAVRTDDTVVLGNERLERAFTHLVENAVVHASADAPHVDVEVTGTDRTLRVSVHDEGPGLPERERRLLETGTVEGSDAERTGFGLHVVRFLVEQFDGSVETAVDDDGSTVTVVLPRPATSDTVFPSQSSGSSPVRPALPHLVVVLVAALVAGVPYGISAELLGGSIAGIGVFYGAASPVVGWITHEFHSAVFGFVFAGLVSLLPPERRDSPVAYVAVAVGWALVLWAVAAGFVAPVWLRLLGIQVPIPNFSPELLVNHLVWGLSLGVLTALGYDHATPWIARLQDRFERVLA